MSGNSMAFIFDKGYGWRISYSFDTDPTKAAILHIEYADATDPYISTRQNR